MIVPSTTQTPNSFMKNKGNGSFMPHSPFLQRVFPLIGLAVNLSSCLGPGNGTRKTPDAKKRLHYFYDREFFRRPCLRVGDRDHDVSRVKTRIKEPEFQPSPVKECDEFSRYADRSFRSHYFLTDEIHGVTRHCLSSMPWIGQGRHAPRQKKSASLMGKSGQKTRDAEIGLDFLPMVKV